MQMYCAPSLASPPINNNSIDTLLSAPLLDQHKLDFTCSVLTNLQVVIVKFTGLILR
jgi:hypothetical protein